MKYSISFAAVAGLASVASAAPLLKRDATLTAPTSGAEQAVCSPLHVAMGAAPDASYTRVDISLQNTETIETFKLGTFDLAADKTFDQTIPIPNDSTPGVPTKRAEHPDHDDSSAAPTDSTGTYRLLCSYKDDSAVTVSSGCPTTTFHLTDDRQDGSCPAPPPPAKRNDNEKVGSAGAAAGLGWKADETIQKRDATLTAPTEGADQDVCMPLHITMGAAPDASYTRVDFSLQNPDTVETFKLGTFDLAADKTFDQDVPIPNDSTPPVPGTNKRAEHPDDDDTSSSSAPANSSGTYQLLCSYKDDSDVTVSSGCPTTTINLQDTRTNGACPSA